MAGYWVNDRQILANDWFVSLLCLVQDFCTVGQSTDNCGKKLNHLPNPGKAI